MSKKSVFTTITPIPAGVGRETVMATLRSHVEMIDLNPLVIDRYPSGKAPGFASPEEFHATWYTIVDRVSYLPGGMMSGKVTYNACFHDLQDGLQTHVYAPAGLDIRSRWILAGSLPGEPAGPVEMGLNIPKQGLYLREDVTMKCNIMLTTFVKKTLKKAHGTLVDRLMEKAKIVEVDKSNHHIAQFSSGRESIGFGSSAGSPSFAQSRLSVASGRTESEQGVGRRTPPAYGSPVPQYAQLHPHQNPHHSYHSQYSAQSSHGHPGTPPNVISPGMIQDPHYAAAQHNSYVGPPTGYHHMYYNQPHGPSGSQHPQQGQMLPQYNKETGGHPPAVPEKDDDHRDEKGKPFKAIELPG